MKGIAGLDSANCHVSHTAAASAAPRREDIRGASSPFLKVFTAESSMEPLCVDSRKKTTDL
jgi:hypothetical protein